MQPASRVRGAVVLSFAGRTLVIYWCAFRGQDLLLRHSVLARFWGRERHGFFRWGRVSGFRGFFALFLPPSSSPSPPFWWPAWGPFLLLLGVCLQDAGLPLHGQAGAARVFPCLFFLSLPGSVASPSLPPPSALSLSFFLFFFFFLSLSLSLSMR